METDEDILYCEKRINDLEVKALDIKLELEHLNNIIKRLK